MINMELIVSDLSNYVDFGVEYKVALLAAPKDGVLVAVHLINKSSTVVH